MQTSTEKLAELVANIRNAEGTLGMIAKTAFGLPVIGSHVRKELDELQAKPAYELDELLEQVAGFVQGLKSDCACAGRQTYVQLEGEPLRIPCLDCGHGDDDRRVDDHA